MKNFTKTLRKIYEEQKGLLLVMGALLLLGVVVMVVGLVKLSPGSAVVKVGYGDIGRYEGGEWTEMRSSGGYRDGGWTTMLAFPVLALVMSVIHGLIAVKVFEKKGAGLAWAFVGVSILLLLLLLITLLRLSGEG